MGYSDNLSDLNTFTFTHSLTNIYASTYRVSVERHDVLFTLGGVMFIVYVRHTTLVTGHNALFYITRPSPSPKHARSASRICQFFMFSKEYETLRGYLSF